MVGYAKAFLVILTVIQNLFFIPGIVEDQISFNGFYETESYLFKYGEITYEDNNKDGYLLILDKNSNEIINNIIYDRFGIESFVYLADVGNSKIIVVSEEYNFNYDYQITNFKRTNIILYDYSGNYIDEKVYYTKYDDFHNHNNYLVLDYEDEYTYIDNNYNEITNLNLNAEYLEYYSSTFQGVLEINGIVYDFLELNQPGNYFICIIDNGYEYSYEIIINPLIIIEGDISEGYYTNSVLVKSSSEFYINDILYENERSFTEPGIYDLVILGENNYVYSREFKIRPCVSYYDGVSTNIFNDGLEFDFPVKIFANGSRILLDGNKYENTLITSIGNHYIKVFGINGLEMTYQFIIYPNIHGVEDGGVYNQVEIIVFGEGKLNSETVTGTICIDVSGDYELKTMFNDEVYKIYNFTIVEEAVNNEEQSVDFKVLISYACLVILVVGVYIIFRKK